MKEVVGDKVYETWIDMIQTLAPDGRTHRLAPLVAAMLRYSSAVAWKEEGDSPDPDSVAYSLLVAEEAGEPDEVQGAVLDVVETLFLDAGVPHERVNRRGDSYSVADATVSEFLHWYDMPWEA